MHIMTLRINPIPPSALVSSRKHISADCFDNEVADERSRDTIQELVQLAMLRTSDVLMAYQIALMTVRSS